MAHDLTQPTRDPADRIAELLAANNRLVEARRDAEAEATRLRELLDVYQRGHAILLGVAVRGQEAVREALVQVKTARKEIGDLREAARLGLPPVVPAFKATHRHAKGGLYMFVTMCTVEADMSVAVLYQGQDGRLWVRPLNQWYDRFTALDADFHPRDNAA